jgi:GT2 family glycosyltransferase
MACDQPLGNSLVEVIVADDFHDSNLRNLLHLSYPWCRYTEGPSRGPAANRNYGAQLALGDWLVFVDDDCIPQPGWIEAYKAHVNTSNLLEGRVSALGVRRRGDEECPLNERGGLLLSCNFAIQRSLFEQIGGFNEVFPFPAMEDVEIYTRLRKSGIEPLFIKDALVLHPWRPRKNSKYVSQHAQSVAKYVHLHPETYINFKFFSQLKKCLRSVRSALLVLQSFPSRQILRSLGLDIYGHFLTWYYVRANYNKTMN